MPDITLKLIAGDKEWEVTAPITKVDIKVLDWLCDRLQEKLANDSEGSQYLSQ